MSEQPETKKVFDSSTFRDKPVSFVRRSGRMTPSQIRAWDESRDEFVLDIEHGPAATSVADGVTGDPFEIFGRKADLIVEVGSGQGHQILHAATAHPETNFLAVEVFRAGLARTVIRAQDAGLTNLKLAEVNAPELLEKYLPAGSVSEIWVFFPDPWKKARHHKRRLISEDFARIAHQVLRAGGVLRLGTDWENYAEQMREVLDAAPGFEREFSGEWAPRFDGRVLTAFEQKGITKDRPIRDLAYRRI
ncbi:MAG: tRNA (guanosine(46)-N7)-methyltransferase TrmB [Leucobacter sp.]